MPSTLPTHPLAVLPLKLWRPRRFDGVAMVAGAAAPDTAYAFDRLLGWPPRHGVHAWGYTPEHLFGALWWSVPVALLIAWLIRLGAPTVAAHLGRPGGWAADYGVLGRNPHRWWITGWSAAIGIASHLLWDFVTHPGPLDAWFVICRTSDVASLFLTPLFIWYAGSRRLLRRWHGAPPAVERRPALFWLTTAVVFGAGALVTWSLGYHGPHIVGVRLITALMLGLLAGAAAVRAAGTPPAPAGDADLVSTISARETGS
ncbi:DUF4184 family protein [Dactylosporangium aurantiacum]|uniref:DUF4184 family protein n=1 Tax=Dactylosporangium aurantiacum TaxID=35754 RepID=A0A9Q9IKJ3_9ACTN|nr:DUF4184 family protein [Dactylosporangium aurantiacum]MDG6101234.1 DUF4184 family protein [Dactylosporangium aurantiacum]UWZ54748.1 DUF4184 family protein [Dactylosporangium aurantiacum]